MFLRRFLDPANAVRLFVAALIAVYLLLPLYAYFFDNYDVYNLRLAVLTFISCIMIVIGASLPIFDDLIHNITSKFRFDGKILSYGIIASFTIFLFATFLTADHIPIFSYFSGANANELSDQRGELFKGREGWQSILLYLFTFFSQAFVPYAIAYLFIARDRLRYIAIAIFFLFTISFLQKFLFVNAIIPLAYAYSITMHKSRKSLIVAVIAVPIILYILTRLSMGSGAVSGAYNGVGAIFSADYVPTSAMDTLWWRAIAVPVFTATDTLHVFYERLGGDYLYGSSSSFIAFLTGAERVNIERYVFDYQWGWNDTANANTVYLVDAFVNFGWIGVCIFSLIIGQSLRWFSNSRDLAMRSLWPLYCLGLFNATFVGVLLSNGFLLVLGMLLFACPKSIVTGAARRPPFSNSTLDKKMLPEILNKKTSPATGTA